MLIFLLGISITINIISIITFIIIYRYSLKGIKHKIENYALDNFMDQDFDINKIEKS